MLKGIFYKWGVKYFETSNADEAISFCAKTQVDLILMDLNMPGTSGLDATKIILQQNPSNKIMAISASTKDEDIAACNQAGMIGYLSKPFSESELFELIVDKMDLEISQLPEKEIKENQEDNVTINFDSLMHLANNDESFFREMLEIFIRSAKNGIDEIEKNYRSNNLGVVAEAAHKLASPTKHIQAIELFNLLKELEENILNNTNLQNIAETIELIKHQLDKLVPHIEQFLNKNKLDNEP